MLISAFKNRRENTLSLLKLKIPPRKRKCLKCEKAFLEESTIASLVKGEVDEPIREDYCHACLEITEDLKAQVWGHWEIFLKKRDRKINVDQKAMELFKEQMDLKSGSYCYFLADYLRRKRQLVLRSELKKESMIFFEEPITNEVFGLEKIHLKAEDLHLFKKRFLDELNPDLDEQVSQDS